MKLGKLCLLLGLFLITGCVKKDTQRAKPKVVPPRLSSYTLTDANGIESVFEISMDSLNGKNIFNNATNNIVKIAAEYNSDHNIRKYTITIKGSVDTTRVFISYTKNTTTQFWDISNVENSNTNVSNLLGYSIHTFLSGIPKTSLKIPSGINDSIRIIYKDKYQIELTRMIPTTVSGQYDTSEKCIYTLTDTIPNRQYGTDDMTMWLLECISKFSNSRFNDITTYFSLYCGKSLSKQTYFKNNAVTSSYHYAYAIDTNKCITYKLVTDNNGKTSKITYKYTNW